MKIKRPYILLILNCERYKDKAEKQKQTWLKTIPDNVVYFHIIGSREKCGNADYWIDHENHVIYTSTDDDYLSLPAKIITAIQSINETYDYEYIFKTDDDQDLIRPHFFTVLIPLLCKSRYNYGGKQISVPDHYSSYYKVHKELPRRLFLKATEYCNGRFYLLSNDAVANLLEKKQEISQQIIEDHTIGLYLDRDLKEKCLFFDTDTYFRDTQS